MESLPHLRRGKRYGSRSGVQCLRSLMLPHGRTRDSSSFPASAQAESNSLTKYGITPTDLHTHPRVGIRYAGSIYIG